MMEIYPDPETLTAAARLFAEQAQGAVEALGRFSVALSGGSTRRLTYELPATDSRSSSKSQSVVCFSFRCAR